MFKRILETLRKGWAWLGKQPLALPFLRLLYSRKGMIAAALVVFILTNVPALQRVEPELGILTNEVVLIVLIGIITSLGYAAEDVAAKWGSGPKDELTNLFGA